MRVRKVVRGGFYGTLAGSAFGLVLGLLLAPVYDPRHPVRHEWYMMQLVAYIVWSAAGGSLVGAVLGAARRREPLLGALAGLVLGAGLGVARWAGAPSPPEHAYTGGTIILAAFGGAALGVLLGIVRSWMRPGLRP